MGAAKTAQAIITAYNYKERGQEAFCMKPMIDTRSSNKLESRLGVEWDAIVVSKEDSISTIINNEWKGRFKDVVIVDEIQFFTPMQIWQLAEVVDNLCVPVICYGLRSDFQGNLFPGSAQLLTLADEIHEIKTMCHCGKKAIMNIRLDKEGKIIRDGEQILIGGNESYIALCRRCYINNRVGG